MCAPAPSRGAPRGRTTASRTYSGGHVTVLVDKLRGSPHLDWYAREAAERPWTHTTPTLKIREQVHLAVTLGPAQEPAQTREAPQTPVRCHGKTKRAYDQQPQAQVDGRIPDRHSNCQKAVASNEKLVIAREPWCMTVLSIAAAAAALSVLRGCAPRQGRHPPPLEHPLLSAHTAATRHRCSTHALLPTGRWTTVTAIPPAGWANS